MTQGILFWEGRALGCTLRSDYFLQADDILIVKSFEQLDLAYGCDGESLLLIIHSDLFQGHSFLRLFGLPQVDLAISALTYLIQLLVTASKTTVRYGLQPSWVKSHNRNIEPSSFCLYHCSPRMAA